MKVLVAGWFSFEQMGATAGDLIAKDQVCHWLDKADVDYDVALEAPFTGGVAWRQVNPQHYTHVVFVCGPFGNGWPVDEFLEYFSASSLVGVNLSMLETLDRWNPFDLLLERDSSRAAYPDLVFLGEASHVPIVGLILVEPQKEYGRKAQHEKANEMIGAFLSKQTCAVVPIDTRLDVPNRGGLRSPEEIESVIARMDMVVTTRLHGMVLALKNGVPALVVDAIQGGAKISRQASVIHWPNVFCIDELTEGDLSEGYQYCLTEQARNQTYRCTQRAIDTLSRHAEIFWDLGLSTVLSK